MKVNQVKYERAGHDNTPKTSQNMEIWKILCETDKQADTSSEKNTTRSCSGRPTMEKTKQY